MGWMRLVWVILGILWWIGRLKRVGHPAPRRPCDITEPAAAADEQTTGEPAAETEADEQTTDEPAAGDPDAGQPTDSPDPSETASPDSPGSPDSPASASGPH